MNVFIDIETIPSQRNESRIMAAAKVAPPASIKKAETLAKWEAESRPALEEEQWRKTSLNGAWGEIACICWAVEDGPVQTSYRPTLADSEADVLRQFLESVAEDQRAIGNRRMITWVGHNLANFDLRFVWQRAVVLGVKPPIALQQDAAPWSDRICDTMTRWAGVRGSIKLTELCDALRIDVGHEDTITGAQVWDTYKAGDVDTVVEHCRADVERVRAVFNRICFL